MATDKKIEYAKYLGVKVFSNKRYRIQVMLFDHVMARVNMHYKKRKDYLRLCWRGCPGLIFDEARRESVYDTWDCLYFLQMDKTARKWFRRVLRPCFERFLLPNGVISAEIAEEYDSIERQQDVVYWLPHMEEEEERVLRWK